MKRVRKKHAGYEQILLWLVVLVVLLATIQAHSFTIPFPQIAIILALIALLVITALALTTHYRSKRRTERARALKGTMIDRLTGLEFEKYVAELLKSRNFKITMTPYNDYGVDLVAKKDDNAYAVQIKRYTTKLNQDAVRQPIAGKLKYKCNCAMVITNNYFTHSAKVLAEANQCDLVDRDKLGEWVAEFQNRR